MTRTLSDYSVGRDNNFNLLRLVAASMVLVSHSYTLATGDPTSEPFASEIGLTLGTIAVHVFFVTSGFLVTASLLARRNVAEFLAARALRIYPALWVCQFLTVIIVGLMFTRLPAEVFFSLWGTWHSVVKNCVLVRGIDAGLPGAFGTVPFASGGVNSSLWTLPIELGLYLKVALAWLTLSTVLSIRMHLFRALCLALAVGGTFLSVASFVGFWRPVFYIPAGGWLLTALFFSGATLRLFQRHVPVSHWLAVTLALCLLLSSLNHLCFGIVYRLSLPYAVLYLAYVPPLRRWRIKAGGDYSYGIYIYAYPVQQSLASFIRPLSPIRMILLAGPITFGLAFASWHLVEKRALALKQQLWTFTRNSGMQVGAASANRP